MSQAGVSANRLELLQIADAVAREKAIDRDVVITAMEDAIQKAAKSRYGSENEIKAEVDPKTGEISLARLLEVVEDVTLEATQIALAQQGKEINSLLIVGCPRQGFVHRPAQENVALALLKHFEAGIHVGVQVHGFR